MKIAMCGTATWAQNVHLKGLAANPDLELVGVYGRNAARTGEVAEAFGIAAFGDYGEMLQAVEAVSFAVPPEAQASLALQAAEAGRHLLLEKPVALTLAEAERLDAALAGNGATALCFLTRMYIPLVRAFIEKARAVAPRHGSAVFRSGALVAGPYAASAWRQEEFGALRDGAPHAMSVLCAVLGPVTAVTRAADDESGLRLSLSHAGGRTSDIAVSLREADPALVERYEFTGTGEPAILESYDYDRPQVFRGATDEFFAAARAGAPHPSFGLGLHLVAVVEAAEKALRSSAPQPVAPVAGAAAVGNWPRG